MTVGVTVNGNVSLSVMTMLLVMYFLVGREFPRFDYAVFIDFYFSHNPMGKADSLVNIASVLRQCSTFLFDCDGVLWDSHRLLPGAVDVISYLLETGRGVFLITNNSTKSVEQYADKCSTLGLPISQKHIVCSASVTANYLEGAGIHGPVYVIGHSGIGLELDKLGITHFGIGPDDPQSTNVLHGVTIESNTNAVVVGFDWHFNYRKLLRATSYIARGLPFYATNEDAQLPAEETVLPGTGSIVAAVKYASGKDPIVMGKPHQPTFDFLCSRHGLDAKHTIMIGDRLDTDIWFGNRFGMHTACVMTGVTNSQLLHKVQTNPSDQHLRPSFSIQSVGELLSLLKSDDK